MSIYFNENVMQFQLDAGNSSYVMKVHRGYLMHIYWGKFLGSGDHSYMLRFCGRPAFSANMEDEDRSFSLDEAPLEYPAWGRSDLRTPAIEMEYVDGSSVTDLKYVSYRMYPGKPQLTGLPATYAEQEEDAETLEILLADRITNAEVKLFYTIFSGRNVISRWVEVHNAGNEAFVIKRVMSACIDYDSGDYDWLSNYGAWVRERYIQRQPLIYGTQMISSRRGSSSHNHNPFMVLLDKNADEDKGEAYGYSLVYSGNFEASVEKSTYNTARAFIGINHEGFRWRLEPGESFTSPEAVLVYSEDGLGDMSRTYHRLYRSNLCRGMYKLAKRPPLINSWEAFYFDFNTEKLAGLAEQASSLGIELFVLDDGWFGKRNDDFSSLGDWNVNTGKLPGGLEALGDRLKKNGIQFGIWFEPEMVSPDSDLYRAHPDWCIHVEGRPKSIARSQFILDLSRKEVCDYVYGSVAAILSSGRVTYVKWDYNRNMTEAGSSGWPAERQGEVPHRFILGLYGILERLVTQFPRILFESCSGGGGRFDPGMLYYMPQTWTSDCSDAIERLKIQYGTSMIYPLSSISAHVSASPNHQTGRVTPMRTRIAAALTGAFGFELDLTRLSEQEKNEVAQAVQLYNSLSSLLVNGDYYRLRDPYNNTDCAWMFVEADCSEAFVAYVKINTEINTKGDHLHLKGLDCDSLYIDLDSSEKYTGSQLMNYGLQVPGMCEYDSRMWHLKKV